MASNTEHLNLLKKDPVADGNETFNIETMLNDNWDKIDAAVGEMQEELADIDIPHASLTGAGIVQLSSATDSVAEDRAATPKAVKDVALQAKSYTDTTAAPKSHTHTVSDLPTASTQARGVVQLNTSTNSTATNQAATPSAVKAAMDQANAAFQSGNERKKNVVDALIALGVSASMADSWDTLVSKMGTVNKGLDRYFLFRRGVINHCNFIEVSRGGDGYASFAQSGSELYMTASCINNDENRSKLIVASTLQQDLSRVKYILFDPLLRDVKREYGGYPYIGVGVCTPALLNTELFSKETSFLVDPSDNGRSVRSVVLDVSDLAGVFHLKMRISAEYKSRIEIGISNILLTPHD